VADDHGSRLSWQVMEDVSSFAYQKLKFNVIFTQFFCPAGAVTESGTAGR
jgi:hypothetical protein